MFETTKNLEIEPIKFLNKKFRVVHFFCCTVVVLQHNVRTPSIRLLKGKMALGICVFLDWEHVWKKAHCNLYKQHQELQSRFSEVIPSTCSCLLSNLDERVNIQTTNYLSILTNKMAACTFYTTLQITREKIKKQLNISIRV